MRDEELFADSISAIAITGSVVRIDFASLSPAEGDAKKQHKSVFRQRVVMPVEGFVQSFGVMARAMQQLEQKGVITKTPPDAKRADAARAAPAGSPNFK